MEGKYKSICNELHELGYTETLTIESVPLVLHLLADLKTTTLSLQKYMGIAKQALEVKFPKEYLKKYKTYFFRKEIR